VVAAGGPIGRRHRFVRSSTGSRPGPGRSLSEVPSVLVVDDDPTVSEVVGAYLERAGFAVTHAGEGAGALELARQCPPDLVVLDVMLPGLDGIEVCRRLRAVSEVPIIMLTALDGEMDRVLGLEVGADDYLTKPFSPRELVLRVQSVLRRTGRHPLERTAPATASEASSATAGRAADSIAGPVRDGDLELDLLGRRAWLHGRALSLTVREFDLLSHLVRHPAVAFTREDLMRQIWGWDFGDLSTVTVHVRRVRSKVEADPASPVRLVTVWGVGYRWDAASAVPAAPRDALS
jgi:two-component system response regulator ResD